MVSVVMGVAGELGAGFVPMSGVGWERWCCEGGCVRCGFCKMRMPPCRPLSLKLCPVVLTLVPRSWRSVGRLRGVGGGGSW